MCDEAYLAGLVDGEGTLVVRYYTQPGFQCFLLITNSHLPTLQYLHERWGGRPPRLASKNWALTGTKPWYTWKVFGKESLPILQGIYPYLRIKKELAALYIEFLTECSPGSRQGVTPYIELRRLQIVIEAKALSKRSKGPRAKEVVAHVDD